MTYVEIDSADERTFLSPQHLNLLARLKSISVPYRVKYASDGVSFKVYIPEQYYNKFRESELRGITMPRCSNCGK